MLKTLDDYFWARTKNWCFNTYKKIVSEPVITCLDDQVLL